MRKRFITKILFFSILVLGLNSCNLPANQPSPLPSQPSPTLTVELTPNPITPSAIPASPTESSDSFPGESVIQVNNAEQLEIFASISMDEPVRVKWSLDQNSFVLLGYQSFWVYGFPSLDLLYTSSNAAEEMVVDFSPNGIEYATTSDQTSITIRNWQDNTSRMIQTDSTFTYGEFSPDGKEILLNQQDQWAGEIYDVATGQLLTTITGFETAAPVYSLSFGQDGKHVIWHARATIQVSEIASNTIGTAMYHEDFLSGFALSPDGHILATSTLKMENDTPVPLVFFYRPMEGELLGTVPVSIPAYSLDFSPDSSLLAVSDGKDLVLIDSASRVISARFPQSIESINQVLFSPFGNILTTTGTDQVVNFWNVK